MTLKTPDRTQTRNILSKDERVLALVRFIARRAAEKDYKELLDVLKNKPEYDIVSLESEDQ